MNLLPEQEKKAVRREYLFRIATIAFALSAAAVAIGIVSLVPSYVLSLTHEESQRQQLEEAKAMQDASSGNDILEVLTTAKEKLGVLVSENAHHRFSEWIKIVLDQKTDGIFVEGIFISQGKQETTVSVVGIAATRERLQSFVERIRTADFFDTVVLPVENLANDKDIEFSISLTKAI